MINGETTSTSNGGSSTEPTNGGGEPQRCSGTILVAGEATSEIVHAARVLKSVADTTLTSGPEALATLARIGPDLIVADERVGGQSGEQFLEQAASIQPSAVRILLAGDAGRQKNTAATVFPKPVETSALRALCTVALRYAATQRTARDLQNENDHLRGIETELPSPELDDLGDVECYGGFLTRSPAMKRVLRMLGKIEGTDTTTLIYGETGTGKELVARAIHAHSRRASGRIVAVNLGAVVDPLRESELFGHVRGAFTGATENRGGLFVEANGGCIFLDEIAEATPGLQVALLRVLEEGVITPVGSDRPRRVDVRIIAATNRNLAELVRKGCFRRDLYYRLNVFPVEIPPLRERQEDIFPLANHFLAFASQAVRKRVPGISREARAALEAYQWEGNVRELRNVMERAAILCKGGLVIAADLPMTTASDRPNGCSYAGTTAISIPPGGATLQELEREIFLKTLALTNGNQSQAARILGLRESTFRFRLRKLGIASRRVSLSTSQSTARTQPPANA
jgi:DNA-binding NtrC family response regulator